MAKCDTCHNDYDKTFQILLQGEEYNFDSFECAIHKLAPTCANCSCRILGHGIEASGVFFCCANCSTNSGEHGAKDRLE